MDKDSIKSHYNLSPKSDLFSEHYQISFKELLLSLLDLTSITYYRYE